MAEEDYNRGRRGGDAKVSIDDWDRYRDWKTGHDEWEKEQDDRFYQSILELGDKELIEKEFQRRLQEIDRKTEAKLNILNNEIKRDRERKHTPYGYKIINFTGAIIRGIVLGMVAGALVSFLTTFFTKSQKISEKYGLIVFVLITIMSGILGYFESFSSKRTNR